MLENIPGVQRIAASCVAFLIAITVHEYAHARAALAAGDDTAERMGRVSLNPLDHLDPIGTLMFLVTVITGFGLGWGKPVPVNHLRFNNPRWDNLRVSLWGPLSNIITAVALSLLLRLAVALHWPAMLFQLIFFCMMFNLMIAFFNLIPVPPLDGSHILSSLLPYEAARKYDDTMGRFGMLILLGLLVTGVLSSIIGPPLDLTLSLLTYKLNG